MDDDNIKASKTETKMGISTIPQMTDPHMMGNAGSLPMHPLVVWLEHPARYGG